MGKMKYVNIPFMEKPVSRIFYGTAGQPFIMGGDGNELLDAIYETGVNAFDTARGYMLSEKSLGNWIAERGNRDKIVLLSKCGHPSLFRPLPRGGRIHPRFLMGRCRTHCLRWT